MLVEFIEWVDHNRGGEEHQIRRKLAVPAEEIVLVMAGYHEGYEASRATWIKLRGDKDTRAVVGTYEEVVATINNARGA